MDEGNINPEPDMAGSSELTTTAAAFPTEPFPCPNCGQLLAPSCRTCVACHQPVDFNKVNVAEPAPALSVPRSQAAPSAAGRTQFSWRIFAVILGIYLMLAIAAERFLTAAQYQMALVAVLVGSSCWVFYDARLRRVQHALRWGISSLLLWIVVFPWYLSRRRAPETPCPLMEAETSVFMRALLWLMLILFLIGVAAALIHKVPH